MPEPGTPLTLLHQPQHPGDVTVRGCFFDTSTGTGAFARVPLATAITGECLGFRAGLLAAAIMGERERCCSTQAAVCELWLSRWDTGDAAFPVVGCSLDAIFFVVGCSLDAALVW